MSRYFSMALNVRGWGCVIAGGGAVALGRAKLLHDAGARLTVVAPAFDAGFSELTAIERHERTFQDADLEDAFLAVAATNDAEVNRAVAEGCATRGILCNVVDDPERSTFIVPAVVDRGPLQISVTTSGASPAFAARVRDQLEDWLPGDVTAYVEFLGDAREAARDRIPDRDLRRAVARYLASTAAYARYKGLDAAGREAWLESILSKPESIEGETP